MSSRPKQLVRNVLCLSYLSAIAVLPFVPHWLNLRALERSGCLVMDPCFDHAVPFISEGGNFMALGAVLLWPLVILLIWRIFRGCTH